MPEEPVKQELSSSYHVRPQQRMQSYMRINAYVDRYTAWRCKKASAQKRSSCWLFRLARASPTVHEHICFQMLGVL